MPGHPKARHPIPGILPSCALAAMALVLSCAPGCRSQPGLPPPASSFRAQAKARLAILDLEARCGQLLLIGVGGGATVPGATLDLIRRVGPGGILLFGFNAEKGPEALAGLIGSCQDAAAAGAARQPLAVAIDHEGGSVFRFKQGLTRLPAAAVVGERGPDYAALLGRRAGLELSAVGVNLALAPVVETLDDSNDAFLGTRAYSRDPRRADACAGAFIEGLETSGVAATAKHFPGNASVDPHRGLPVLDLAGKNLDRDYLGRFRSAMDHGVASILLSHVVVPEVDPARPATLSPAFATGLLKDRLGFDGVVMTDDLFMAALSRTAPSKGGRAATVESLAVEAAAAGADLLMLSDGLAALRVRDALVAAVRSGAVPASRVDDAVLRILELKLRFGMDAAFDAAGRKARLAALPALVEESRSLVDKARGR